MNGMWMTWIHTLTRIITYGKISFCLMKKVKNEWFLRASWLTKDCDEWHNVQRKTCAICKLWFMTFMHLDFSSLRVIKQVFSGIIRGTQADKMWRVFQVFRIFCILCSKVDNKQNNYAVLNFLCKYKNCVITYFFIE